MATKKKLDLDRSPYRILGACDPPWAYRAIEAEPSIGLLLPWKVVVRQDKAGSVFVEFMRPTAVLDLVAKPEINCVSRKVRARLEQVTAVL